MYVLSLCTPLQPDLVTGSPTRVICSLSLRGLQMTLRRLPVTKEGCKGVQLPTEQTLLLLLSTDNVK